MKIPNYQVNMDYGYPKTNANQYFNRYFEINHEIKSNNPFYDNNLQICNSPVNRQKKTKKMNDHQKFQLNPSFQRNTFNPNFNFPGIPQKQNLIQKNKKINFYQSNFFMFSNMIHQKLQNSKYQMINKSQICELSIRSDDDQIRRITPHNSKQKMKKKINSNNSKAKIIQKQKIQQRNLNQSNSKSNINLKNKIKKGYSPQSTTFSTKCQYFDQIKSIQQRKKSQDISNISKYKQNFTMITKQEICKQIYYKNQNQITKQSKKKQKIIEGRKNYKTTQLKNYIKKKQSKNENHQSPRKTIQPKNTTNENDQQIIYRQNHYKLNHNIDKTFQIPEFQTKPKSKFQRKRQSGISQFQEERQKTLSQFYIGKAIGKGKFGQVYEAKHKKSGFLLAIKKIYKQKIKEYNLQKQIVEQIKIQAYAIHPNIVNMYGLFWDNNHIYLILQFMQGGTLFDYLSQRQKLSAKEVSLTMKEISLAVKYLHKNQIAHRDIKPQNILFSMGVAKLCDFGWSARVINKRKTYCGTFDYVPPQMLERKQYDQCVDLWCLGVLMYELLTGKVPFYHKQKVILMNRIINVDKQKIYYPDYVCREAIQVIQGLLRKNPHQRIKAQNLLQQKFFKLKFDI